mgnify:CR=1 FL=1
MALTAKKLDTVRADVPVKTVSQQALVRVNFNVSADTRRRWKVAAIERGISLGDLIEDAVNTHLGTSA